MASTYHCMWEMEKMFPRGGHSAAVTSHKDRQPGRRQEGGEYGKGGMRWKRGQGCARGQQWEELSLSTPLYFPKSGKAKLEPQQRAGGGGGGGEGGGRRPD